MMRLLALMMIALGSLGCQCGEADITRTAPEDLQPRLRMIRAPEPSRGGFFALPMDFDGEMLVAGQRGANNALRLFVLDPNERTDPVRIDKPVDAASSAFFGREVAVRGDFLLVGSTGFDGLDPGEVHLFRRERGAWSRIQLVRSPPGHSEFGSAIAMSESFVAIGQGAVSLFRRERAGLVHVQTLWAPDRRLTEFGSALALNGDRLIVGAPHEPFDSAAEGRAYIYRWNGETWELESELSREGVPAGSQFGAAVGLAGDLAAVGAPLASALDSDGVDRRYGVGAVRLYRRGEVGWSPLAGIAPPPDSPSYFGAALALEPTHLIVGASGLRARSEAGAVFLLERAGDGRRWHVTRSLRDESATTGDEWGADLALARGQLAIAADHMAPPIGGVRGAVVVYPVWAAP